MNGSNLSCDYVFDTADLISKMVLDIGISRYFIIHNTQATTFLSLKQPIRPSLRIFREIQQTFFFVRPLGYVPPYNN